MKEGGIPEGFRVRQPGYARRFEASELRVVKVSYVPEPSGRRPDAMEVVAARRARGEDSEGQLGYSFITAAHVEAARTSKVFEDCCTAWDREL
jgi:hypothetical protein